MANWNKEDQKFRDEQFVEQIETEPEYHLENEQRLRFEFNDKDWEELCKLRAFDIVGEGQTLTAREAVEDAVGKYIAQEKTGVNS